MKQLPVSEEGYKYLTEGNCQMCGKSFVAHPFVHETFGVCPECEKTLTKQQIINIRSKTQDEYEMDGRFVKHKNVEEDYQEDTISSDGAESAACANRFQHYKTIKRNLMMMNLR